MYLLRPLTIHKEQTMAKYHFPLKGKTVKARNLREARKLVEKPKKVKEAE